MKSLHTNSDIQSKQSNLLSFIIVTLEIPLLNYEKFLQKGNNNSGFVQGTIFHMKSNLNVQAYSFEYNVISTLSCQ